MRIVLLAFVVGLIIGWQIHVRIGEPGGLLLGAGLVLGYFGAKLERRIRL